MPISPAFISALTFIAVIIIIMLEKLHLTVAALLGALILVFTHIITLKEAVSYISQSYSILALFFGVMVLVRAFEPTNIFDYLAAQIIRLAKGQGKLLLMGIVGVTASICAVLPNVTTVMLLAPLIPPLAADIGLDFAPLLILIVLVANSSGILTLVGDLSGFLIGDAINITYIEYIQRLSLGGVLAILTIFIMLPWLFPKIWRTKFEHLEDLPHPRINHPRVLALGSIIILFVLTFFIIGESFPTPISPAAVALMGATLALLLAHQSKIDTVPNILKDVDWSTLIFFMSIFVMIGTLGKTGIISNLSGLLTSILGRNIALGCISLIFFVGFLSSVVPNIPLVVGMIPLLKQYLFNAGFTSAETLSPDFAGQFPPEVLPLFYAMLFGATLGGNGTLLGASSNIVAAGIAEQHNGKISFKTFLRYGMPVMLAQLVISSLYVLLAFLI